MAFKTYIVYPFQHPRFPKPFSCFLHCLLWKFWHSSSAKQGPLLFHASRHHPCTKFTPLPGIFARMSNLKSMNSLYQAICSSLLDKTLSEHSPPCAPQLSRTFFLHLETWGLESLPSLFRLSTSPSGLHCE